MNERVTLDPNAELKKSVRLPAVAKLLAENEIEPVALEQYLDSGTALSDPGLHGYPPDIAIKPDFPASILTAYWGGDAIVPHRVARQALRQSFGLDHAENWQFSGDTQDCFIKSGFWADVRGRTQNCVVAFPPNDTLIAAFVNSPVPGDTIQGIASTQLQANIA